MRRRRSRFTVTMTDGTKQVVLAYDTVGARSFFTGRGYDVRSVTAGDHRVAKRNAQTKAVGGFRLNHAAIRDACELLGVKMPVAIKFNGRVGATHGNHRFTGSSHRIMVKSYLTVQQASETLWHELTHALQAERDCGSRAAWVAQHSEQRRYSYQRRPIEIEARKMSEDMADLLLTKPL